MVLFLKTQLFNFLSRTPHRAIPSIATLDPRILTVGFARRFASYKRVNLLLEDRERLLGLLTDKDRPIQIVFSGKAHPRDGMGCELVKRIYHFVNTPEIRNRAIFVEDYDINVSRHLAQGVDLWLNTPSQGYEASGTSGMKVA